MTFPPSNIYHVPAFYNIDLEYRKYISRKKINFYFSFNWFSRMNEINKKKFPCVNASNIGISEWDEIILMWNHQVDNNRNWQFSIKIKSCATDFFILVLFFVISSYSCWLYCYYSLHSFIVHKLNWHKSLWTIIFGCGNGILSYLLEIVCF